MNLEQIGIPYTEFEDNKEFELFWHISQQLVSKSYLQEILQLIVTMTANVMQSKICSLMLLDEKKQELAIAATQSLSKEYLDKPPIKVGESISGKAVKERRPISVVDVKKDQSYSFPKIAEKEGVAALLSVPMVIGDRVIGVINSYNTKPHVYTDHEIKILQAVANQAAVAIENTQLRQENIQAKQALEERKLVERAKGMLMDKDKLSEKDAHTLIQKTSRDKRKPMAEVAQAIILAYELRK